MKGLEAEKLPGSVGWGEGRSLQAEGHGDRRAACLRDDRAPRDCCYSLRAGEEKCGSLVQTDDRGPRVSVESTWLGSQDPTCLVAKKPKQKRYCNKFNRDLKNGPHQGNL